MVLGEFPDQLVVAAHHVRDNLEIPWTEQREIFYGLSGTPHVRIDGKHRLVGASSCEQAASRYRDAITQRLSETGGTSPVSISGVHTSDGSTISVWATFALDDPALLADPRAFVLLLEDEVDEGGGLYDHVTRAGYEQSVSLASPGDLVIVTASFAVEPEWNLGHISVIALLQSMEDDKEVYQTARMRYATGVADEIVAAVPSEIGAITPNPLAFSQAQRYATIRLHLTEQASHAPVALDLLDINGRRVRDLVRGTLPVGMSTSQWDGRDTGGRPVDAGVYYLRFTTLDGVRSARMVVLR